VPLSCGDCVPALSAYLEADSFHLRTAAVIESPCEKICIVDTASGLCRGCGRSLSEIERWTAYSDGERRRIMAELPARLTAMTARAAPHS
jgi:predicted Fe-S protein YdhL (DUF1289 family)